MKLVRKGSKRPVKRPSRNHQRSKKVESFYEVTCCAGLERFVQRELRRHLGPSHSLATDRHDGEVLFSYSGAPRELLGLSTIHDPFLVIPIESPRPRGMLEPLVFKKIIERINKLHTAVPHEKFSSFSLSAAGSDSKDLKRIREAFAAALKLPEQEHGELYMRLRKAKNTSDTWELLVRISARPVSHRAWRVAHYRGALDASIARVVVELVAAKKEEVFVDLMCGSGTLVIEQLKFQPVKEIFAFDTSTNALECAEKNCQAIAAKTPFTFIEGDACATELPEESIDTIVSNPPWGESLGKKQTINQLYGALLKECARLLRKGGRLAIVVQDRKALDTAIKETPQLVIKESHRALQGRGFHPTIALIERR